jgi:hypothetical protein
MSAELRNAPCRAKAEATVERTLSNTADQLGIGAVKRAMLPIEVHRHPAVSAILDGRGIDGGLDLVAAERGRESGVYSGLQTTLYAAWLHKAALRDDRNERPRRVETGHSRQISARAKWLFLRGGQPQRGNFANYDQHSNGRKFAAILRTAT